MQSSPYYVKGQFPGAKVKLPKKEDFSKKYTIRFTIDEPLLAKIKQYHIWPSQVCKAELRREVRRRREAEVVHNKQLKRKHLFNRYSGEILST